MSVCPYVCYHEVFGRKRGESIRNQGRIHNCSCWGVVGQGAVIIWAGVVMIWAGVVMICAGAYSNANFSILKMPKNAKKNKV